jgi:mRNA-degrading endonuclease RelE of RelBE toxin-antitoxin system
MNYIICLHPQVQNDYDGAFAWYEEKMDGLGDRFLKAVREKIHEISLHPEAFGSRNRKSFREAKVDFFPYMIVFKINKKAGIIYISSVHHTSKHPRRKFRKE